MKKQLLVLSAIISLGGMSYGQSSNIFEKDGKVGIGTDEPDSKLSIYGTNIEGWNSGIELTREDGGKGWVVVDKDGMKFKTPQDGDGFYFRDNDNNTLFSVHDGGRVIVNSQADVGKGQNPALLIGDRRSHHVDIDGNEIGAFYKNENAILYINGSQSQSNTIINGEGIGKVGIGTMNPKHRLDVNGTIHAREVKVDLSHSADYVFEKYYTGSSTLKADYSMPTLEEVETFTKENNHLPNIPSAKEIKAEGLHLKEMTNLLLQKIEELTLYTIEQEKRLDAQSEENKEQSEFIKEQQKEIQALKEQVNNIKR